jgi:hypothetical protein
MSQQARQEDQWLRRATDAAIAEARKVALGTVPMNTPIGKLNDSQWAGSLPP